MKKFIRDWLGIVDLDSQDIVREVVDKLTTNSDFIDRVSYRIESKINRLNDNTTAIEVNKYVRTEEFLDAIVKRIKDKQL